MTMVETRPITGGVDTHLDVHVAAALDGIGGLLGVESFATTAAGYGELTDWLCSFGSVVRVGIEGTGSYGVGLARYLHGAGIAVVEVNRADRQARRRQGKSDPLDAIERGACGAVRTGGRVGAEAGQPALSLPCGATAGGLRSACRSPGRPAPMRSCSHSARRWNGRWADAMDAADLGVRP